VTRTMTRTELNNFLTILTAKQAELAGATGRRDGIAIERTADALDEVQLSAERELTTRNLERESRLLRNVRAALGRIAEDTYGTCLDCDEEISPKRLHAMPWATLCIACQELADQNSHRRFASHERVLTDAA
jgi:DnaK suppressor protein